ncbi:hypothetical protein TTHERM_00151300 (macronuclear) [Tetrahymena thermophila SB210]|uniref:Uncharacterized protein n=1 Tax=Tetrahymena thermophila (strain SB210) TaxID=312017 RepID=I7MGG1_TETTS|nr:hypothetical protein TTHERM_00151300 [Tetrahymena thermophila SB210]EAS01420.2 hypothetical protein TTHERM_00151300 [Tetrahymena thermophila SB210]|eukprot:XP_001021666.2 hypothetical protein TTHERM_00151300 [Tetrahymena thermophila SB210]
MMQENMFIDENDVQALKSGYEIDMMIQYSIENPQMSFQEIQSIFEETSKKNTYSLDDSFFKTKNGSQVDQDQSQKEILIQNDEIKQIIEVQKMKQKKINVLKNIINAFSSFLLRFEKKKMKVGRQNKKLMNLKQNQNEIKYFLEDSEAIGEQQQQTFQDKQEPVTQEQKNRQVKQELLIKKETSPLHEKDDVRKEDNQQSIILDACEEENLQQQQSQQKKIISNQLNSDNQKICFLNQSQFDSPNYKTKLDDAKATEIYFKQSTFQNLNSNEKIIDKNSKDKKQELFYNSQDNFKPQIKLLPSQKIMQNQTDLAIENQGNYNLNYIQNQGKNCLSAKEESNFLLYNYQESNINQNENESANWPGALINNFHQETQQNKQYQDFRIAKECVDFQQNNLINSESFLSSEKTLRQIETSSRQLPTRSSIEETIADIYNKFTNFQKKQNLNTKSCMQNVLSSFKRFMKDKIINKSNLTKLLNQKVYNKLLEYYLIYFSGIWLESCLVQDKIIHQIVIKFLLKCCYSPSLINMFYASKED